MDLLCDLQLLTEWNDSQVDPMTPKKVRGVAHVIAPLHVLIHEWLVLSTLLVFGPCKLSSPVYYFHTRALLTKVAGKTADNKELEIVRDSPNTITITGYRDQVRENQPALLEVVHDSDPEAQYI